MLASFLPGKHDPYTCMSSPVQSILYSPTGMYSYKTAASRSHFHLIPCYYESILSYSHSQLTMQYIMSVLFVYSADGRQADDETLQLSRESLLKMSFHFFPCRLEFYRIYFTDSQLAIIGSQSEIPCLFTMFDLKTKYLLFII